MFYWIGDEEKTPQRFPLQRLLRRIQEVSGAPIESVRMRRAWGYGEQVVAWDDATNAVPLEESIAVPFELLDRVSAGKEEWFYDVDLYAECAKVRFGIFDSTAMYVEASPEVAAQIVKVFTQVKLDPWHMPGWPSTERPPDGS